MATEEWGNRVLTVFGLSPLPFQAEFEEIHVTRSSDGAELTASRSGRVYVDSAGRTREEFSVPPATQSADSAGPTMDPPLRIAIVNDPVAALSFVIDLESKAVLSHEQWSSQERADSRQGAGPRAVVGLGEPIGERIIEGLICSGFRSRTEHGEAESWFSADIGQVILEVHKATPVASTFRMFNIRRGEPAASLFGTPESGW
jgi:hypothetical protein